MNRMISVFEGPLCCNTGVCGTDPDQALVNFTADLDWLRRQGVTVQRANLAQDPAAFAGSPVARAFMQVAGADGLPLVVVDGVAVSTNRYPSREELAVFAGLASAAGCCSGDAAGANAPGCCGSNNDSTGPSTEGSSCCGGTAPQALPLENTSGSAVQL